MAAVARLFDRRLFLRSATGAALAVLVAGGKAILGAGPAWGQTDQSDDGCCLLIGRRTIWCPFYCHEVGNEMVCWECNGGRCRCCECVHSPRASLGCFSNFSVCSMYQGCCS